MWIRKGEEGGAETPLQPIAHSGADTHCAAYGVPYVKAHGCHECTLGETCSSQRAHTGADFQEGAAAPTMEQSAFEGLYPSGRTLAGAAGKCEEEEAAERSSPTQTAIPHSPSSSSTCPTWVGGSRRVRTLGKKD